MEGRKLNFNQPLLSVRRGASMAPQPEVNRRKTHETKPSLPPLPYYKSELKSGPVRNPGVVPFQWEKMPGRPKDENIVPKSKIRQLAVAPKLPPGRIVNHREKPLDKTPKSSPGSSSRSQTGNKIPPAVDISSTEKAPSEFEGSEKESEGKNISSSDDDNETFVDTSGILSRTESFFNCSVSGVSGLDDPSMASSQFFTDPQTRDFMMGRFLPAAKAVASETPHFSPRKHSGAREKLEPVKRVIKWKQQSPQSTLPHNIHGEEDDDEDEDDDYDEMEDMSAKLCGLLPKFCLLNPIPGMRDHAQAISSVRSVRTRPAYAETCRKIDKKDRANTHRRDVKKILRQHAPKHEPSINENFGSRSTGPVKDGSPHVISETERRFLGLPQECRDLGTSKLDLKNHGGAKFKEFVSLRSAQETTRPDNPAIEKTLYVDSEQLDQSRDSISSSTESRGRNPSVDSLQDIRSLTGVDEKQTSRSQISDTANSNVVSTSENSFQDAREYLHRDKDFNLALVVVQPQKPDVEEVNQQSGLLALAPLLLKSPSESWLSRTLPSMSTKNPSSKSHLGNLAMRSSPVHPNRERMLRSKNQHHMVYQPAGELAPILEN